MMSIVKRAGHIVLLFPLFVTSIVLIYLAASAVGALVPGSYSASPANALKANTKIFLLSSPLHVDLAVPVSSGVIDLLPFLKQSPLPLDNPALEYVSFGWGSRAFYTSAGSYADIGIGPTTTAITGDDAVMRVFGTGKLNAAPDIIPIILTDTQLKRLLDAIRASFTGDEANPPARMIGASLQAGDAFYRANGHFNIFNSCNQWANDVLRQAGVPLGIWTPTTSSLLLSLQVHAPSAVQP